MSAFTIAPDDVGAADVRDLLETHLAFAHGHSPPEDVHALDPAGLTAADISFFSAREDGVLLGFGAMRELDPQHGELKSMHTAEAARRRGVGRELVNHLLTVARSRGYARVSRETGTGAVFRPAQSLYESAGFRPCEPFSAYGPSPYSMCMRLDLTRADPD